MIENKDADLSLLKDYLVSGRMYSKDEILQELQNKQKEKDFLCLLMDDGFLIGYPCSDDAFFVSQVVNYGKKKETDNAMIYLREWAKGKGFMSILAITERKQFRALKKHGWDKLFTVISMEI